MKRREKRRVRAESAGMTLLEIMVVIILIGLLGTLAGVALIRNFQKGKVGVAKAQVCKLEEAVNQYFLQFNKYPSSSEGLQALITAKIWSKKKLPKDPWGRDYVYRFPGTEDPSKPDIFSLGADGKEGGTDALSKDIYCDQD